MPITIGAIFGISAILKRIGQNSTLELPYSGNPSTFTFKDIVMGSFKLQNVVFKQFSSPWCQKPSSLAGFFTIFRVFGVWRNVRGSCGKIGKLLSKRLFKIRNKSFNAEWLILLSNAHVLNSVCKFSFLVSSSTERRPSSSSSLSVRGSWFVFSSSISILVFNENMQYIRRNN